jgi:hypothetical protein
VLRPAILVTTEPHVSGQLKVTVEATNSGGVPDNSLHAIRVITLTNASVEMGGDTIRQADVSVDLDEGTEEVHFFAQREDNTLPYTVTLGVTDDCGEWQTFVGGGPGAP